MGVLTIFSLAKAPRKHLPHGRQLLGGTVSFQERLETQKMSDVLTKPQALSEIGTSPNLKGE